MKNTEILAKSGWEPYSKRNHPDTFALIRQEANGQQWVLPIGDETPLDLAFIVESWLFDQCAGDLEATPLQRCPMEYYAAIITDGRPIDSAVVWQSGYFSLFVPESR
jgi:hypothetical protein